MNERKENTNKNVWYGSGVVTKSPVMDTGYQFKQLDSGTSVLNINLLVEESYTSRGEERTRKTYVPLVAWGEKAEEFESQISEGAIIEVKGHYRNRAYEGRDGRRNYRHDFQIYALDVIEPGNMEEERVTNTEESNGMPAFVGGAEEPTYSGDNIRNGNNDNDDIPF